MNLLGAVVFAANVIITPIGADLTFDGPLISENSDPNPFTQYELLVTFSHTNPSFPSFVVPGYFAADGNAAEGSSSGNKWRCHFRVPHYGRGNWIYSVSFKNGGIPDPTLHGQNGQFFVEMPDLTGKLIYNDTHYLVFSGSKVRYLKNAVGSSENALAYEDFDGVSDYNPDFIHVYESHINDCPSSAPTWKGNKGKGLFGLVQYISSLGMTEFYWTTYNEDGGDGGGVTPWTVPGERLRFDCSRLDQWRRIFLFANSRRMVLQLFLTETENETVLSDLEFRIYIKEIIARFGDLDILINLGEELNDTSDDKIRQLSDWVAQYDSYRTPVGLHTDYNNSNQFNGVMGHPNIHYISYQGDGTRYDSAIVELITESTNAGHPWVVFGDEQGPSVDSDMSNINLMTGFWDRNIENGGSGCSWYFGYQGCCFGDLQMEDYRLAEPLFQLTAQHRLNYLRSNFGDIEAWILGLTDAAGIYDINDDRRIDIADKVLELQLNQN